MIYKTTNLHHRQRAIERFKSLLDKKATIELIEKKPKRTIKQNRYLHLILGWFAYEYGESIEYVKQVFFKQIVNPKIFKTEFVNKKTGEVRDDYRSTASLDTRELTIAIEKFRDYSSLEAGIYLPSPDEKEFIEFAEIELKNNNII